MPNEFSEIAKRYRETSLVQQSAAETLLRLLAIGSSEDVLDVGCGTGNLTQKIRVATSGRVVGIDPAEGMIERAAREHGDGIDFAVLSAEAMSFHEEFDTIFCNSTFQWVRDADKAVAGFAGALRAGGRVGIQAPARSDYCPNFLSAIEAVAATPVLVQPLRTSNRRGVSSKTQANTRRCLSAAGFRCRLPRSRRSTRPTRLRKSSTFSPLARLPDISIPPATVARSTSDT